jgi:hypothetical protein
MMAGIYTSNKQEIKVRKYVFEGNVRLYIHQQVPQVLEGEEAERNLG